MLDLDNLALFKTIDPDSMLKHISGFPQQCHAAWELAQGIVLPERYKQAKSIVVLGLGGSAIGGDFVRTLVQGECPLPIMIHRDYILPAFVGPQTLVIASSYSGDTEETLITSQAALEAGASLVAVTTGGKLAQWAEENKLPCVHFSYVSQPRAAVGYSFSLVLGIICRLGWAADKTADMQEAMTVMENWQAEIRETAPAARNEAKQMAQWLWGCIPVVYGAGYLSEVARRWKGQVNENAKAWGFFEQMPELNHNAILGYKAPRALQEKMRVIMLRSSLDHPRNQKRFQVTEEVLKRQGISCRVVQARGESPLAHLLSTVHFGDYVSYYLATLYQNDPTPVDEITYLKERLAG